MTLIETMPFQDLLYQADNKDRLLKDCWKVTCNSYMYPNSIPAQVIEDTKLPA